MKSLLSFTPILTALCLTFTPLAHAFEHPGGLHTKSQIVVVREKITAEQQPWLDAYNALLKQAETNLEKPSNALEIFDVPGYYDDAKGHRAAMKRPGLRSATHR